MTAGEFQIWDGNGRFWAGGALGGWTFDPSKADTYHTREEADAFANGMGGTVVAANAVGKVPDRVVLFREWEHAAAEYLDARKKVERAERDAEAVQRVYESHGDKLGKFLAEKSAEKTGSKVPDGVGPHKFRAHVVMNGRVFRVESDGLRVDATGHSTDTVAYRFTDVGGSVFDATTGKHTYPVHTYPVQV